MKTTTNDPQQQPAGEEQIRAKRRAVIDALYAITGGPPHILVDAKLAQRLEQAWNEYDAMVRASVTHV